MVEELLRSQCVYIVCVKTTMNNCFLMLSHLKIHVILFMDIVVVMLLCSMLEINDDVLYCVVFCFVVLCCVVLCCVVLCCVVLCCVELCCIVLYCIGMLRPA